MARITEEERKRFHKIVDKAIDKLNSPKNSKKDHWSGVPEGELLTHFDAETKELWDAWIGETDEATLNECYDCINLPLMLADNLNGNK